MADIEELSRKLDSLGIPCSVARKTQTQSDTLSFDFLDIYTPGTPTEVIQRNMEEFCNNVIDALRFGDLTRAGIAKAEIRSDDAVVKIKTVFEDHIDKYILIPT